MRSVRKVLMVDDEPDIRQIGRMSLAKVGKWEVVLATGGLEAVELAKEHRPDLVLLDAMMPGLDGPATLARLRATPETQDIPVIFMTAKVQKQEVARYIEAGAAGVISKPFDPLQLPAEILRILGAVSA
jgi:CheY-like chemotaxis protein